MSGQAYEQLTLFQEDFPVSRSVLPGGEEARKMTVTSGLRCLELYRKSGPLGSLVRTLLASSQWQSQRVYLRWKAESLIDCRTQTIMNRYQFDKLKCCSLRSSEILSKSDIQSKHLLFRLVPSTPRTDEIGLQSWPTPTSRDYKGANSEKHLTRPGGGRNHMGQLANAVKVFATPQSRDYRTGSRQRFLKPEKTKNLNDQIGGQLNPDWVEWLMGFPIGWTSLPECQE